MPWFEVIGTEFAGPISVLTPDSIWEQSLEINWLPSKTCHDDAVLLRDESVSFLD